MKRNGCGMGCPQCRASVLDLREPSAYHVRVSEYLSFPCPNASEGCTIGQIHRDHYNVHIAECEYRPGECLIVRSNCVWTGTAAQVLVHIKNEHKYVRLIQTSADWIQITLDSIYINMNLPRWFFLVAWRGKPIIVHVTLDQASMKMHFKSIFTAQESIPQLKIKLLSPQTEGLIFEKKASVLNFHDNNIESSIAIPRNLIINH